SRKRQSALRLVRIRRLRSSASVSTRVRSGCSAITDKISVANSSSGEMLPPRGFAAALLSSRQRCTHLTADATLTSQRSGASRRDAFVALPPRRARSYGLDNAFPQVTRIGLRHRLPPPARRINAQSLH